MNPDYQRDYVWELSDKQLLIDSIFNNIDIGKFAFIHLDYKTWNKTGYAYEILDGKQRLKTIIDFYENRFSYKGIYYNDLSKHTYVAKSMPGTIAASSINDWHNVKITFQSLSKVDSAVAIQRFANQSQKAIVLRDIVNNTVEFGYYGSLSVDLQIVAIALGTVYKKKNHCT